MFLQAVAVTLVETHCLAADGTAMFCKVTTCSLALSENFHTYDINGINLYHKAQPHVFGFIFGVCSALDRSGHVALCHFLDVKTFQPELTHVTVPKVKGA